MKKLQSEIDRLLKKVSEGVESFENTFDKIQNANNANLKDKYENDLKKEIKKLQRLRDQIKTWLSNNDVKDKSALLENRKLIESHMERFKQVEREMKTKAYSKEGLMNREKLDPKEKEKADACEFVTNAVDELSRQIEKVEFEIEQLESKRGSKKAEQQRKIQELEHSNERRKYHINRLELILRLLENDHLEPDLVNDLKDAIQYYVEYNQEPNFDEDEDLYDDLDLEKEEELFAIRTDEFYGKSDSENDDDEDENDKGQLTTPGQSPSNNTNNKPEPVVVNSKANTPKLEAPAPLKYSQAATATVTPTVTPTVKASEKDNAWVEPPKIVDQPKVTPSKGTVDMKQSSSDKSEAPINNARLPPSLADLGAFFESVKENHKNDTQYKHRMLDISLQHVPDLIDSERPRTYQPRNPYNTPNYYPQQPLHIFDNPALFEKLDMDTLFFIFYYQQGTYQQFLAARELKKQSWRFHKKYLTWFQRHEEPKEITEEYEQGTYVYFDYENAWCQRKKTDFRFDYRFLEESLN